MSCYLSRGFIRGTVESYYLQSDKSHLALTLRSSNCFAILSILHSYGTFACSMKDLSPDITGSVYYGYAEL